MLDPRGRVFIGCWSWVGKSHSTRGAGLASLNDPSAYSPSSLRMATSFAAPFHSYRTDLTWRSKGCPGVSCIGSQDTITEEAKMERREFLRVGGAGMAGALLGSGLLSWMPRAEAATVTKTYYITGLCASSCANW